MACAVPKIILTLNRCTGGAGYYAMAGRGFDPHRFSVADGAHWRDGGRLNPVLVPGPELEKPGASGNAFRS